MRHLRDILSESKKDKEEQKEKKIVFIETDPREAFPNDTISALQKDINKKAKDLEQQWKSSMELVDAAFADLEVPKPGAYLNKRWDQYKQLLTYAIKSLYDARGLKAGWTQTI
jgi:hypothetical protein